MRCVVASASAKPCGSSSAFAGRRKAPRCQRCGENAVGGGLAGVIRLRHPAERFALTDGARCGDADRTFRCRRIEAEQRARGYRGADRSARSRDVPSVVVVFRARSQRPRAAGSHSRGRTRASPPRRRASLRAQAQAALRRSPPRGGSPLRGAYRRSRRRAPRTRSRGRQSARRRAHCGRRSARPACRPSRARRARSNRHPDDARRRRPRQAR